MKRLMTFITSLTLMFSIPYLTSYATSKLPVVAKQDVVGKIQVLIDEYGLLINGIWGTLVIASVLVFIIHFIKLGQYGGIPVVRMKIMRDLLISGICTACLGSFWFIYFVVVRIAMG